MSRTYELVCPAMKLCMWVGQSGGTEGMGNFYSGEPRTMQKLGRFLEKTRGSTLILMDTEFIPDDINEFEPRED